MKNRNVFLAAGLMCCVLLSSCIGSFKLTNKVLAWNQSIGDKFVNEVVFICFSIIPVYSITVFADAVIFNTIEFWNGTNPIAANEVKYLKGDKASYRLETLQAGYNITNLTTKEQITLSYDRESSSWSAKSKGKTITFLTFLDDHHVKLYGCDHVIELSKTGVTAYKEMVRAILMAAN
jgi:hypothetical protein